MYDELVVIVRGDLTKDGKVNVTDQAQIISYVGKTIEFDKYQTLAADVTKDGKVNVISNLTETKLMSLTP